MACGHIVSFLKSLPGILQKFIPQSERNKAKMFDFSNKKQKKVFIRVMVIILILAGVAVVVTALAASAVSRKNRKRRKRRLVFAFPTISRAAKSGISKAEKG